MYLARLIKGIICTEAVWWRKIRSAFPPRAGSWISRPMVWMQAAGKSCCPPKSGRYRPQGNLTLFPPFTVDVDRSGRSCGQISARQSDGFGHPRAGVVHHCEQCPISSATPFKPIRCIKNGIDFGLCEITKQRPDEPFLGNR